MRSRSLPIPGWRQSRWCMSAALLAWLPLAIKLLATAAIVFRAGADYSARQMTYFRSRTDPEVFARMFPAYAG